MQDIAGHRPFLFLRCPATSIHEVNKEIRQSVWAAFFVLKKGGDFVGRPRKFKSAKQLEEVWEEYKNDCDNQMVLTHDFSSKNSEFVSKKLRRAITYTIEGFCVFAGIARSKFYEIYSEDERYRDIVTRMREECEVDARRKFEIGIIPSQLAGLWMSRHGYTTKTDNNVTGSIPVVISNDLEPDK